MDKSITLTLKFCYEIIEFPFCKDTDTYLYGSKILAHFY